MKQVLQGKVISNKMNGTVTVEVSRFKKHPIYGKYIKVSKKYKAFSEEKLNVGTEVAIESTKPMSKEKKWKIIKKI